MSTAPTVELQPRRDTAASVRTEIVLVFLVSLGFSGLTSLVSLIETQIKAARAQIGLSQVQVAVAAPRSSVDVIDLVRQLLVVVQQLAWASLGIYLLWRAGVDLSARLGLNLRRPWRDLAAGVGLAAVIGIPGLFLYLLARSLDLSLTVVGSSLTDTWWRLPVSVLLAVGNGLLEELLVVGYLLTRLEHLRVRPWVAILLAALLRGSYHLYQGYGGFVGNALMGLVFGYVFLRWRRIWPLVVAHSLIDIVVFVGYPLLHGHVSWL
ncbi:CPBP family intramembrane glutamic endopeptidase [Nakamurella endophytica]|uniref:CAAX amino protease n=1 Tax=Nakamurella endophytica TaxID=1748367 RepID=A0A917T611_9ACTN|nr:CPBP family intramembrane glutamic endopeptidase [Nakamurella endophytica]GGM10768.1 CAAX amino protease [Nakamurella endophytica]